MPDPVEPDPVEPDPGRSDQEQEAGSRRPARRRERKAMLLRLDPEVHDALARWAAEDLRSTNAQVAWLLRRALVQAGRLK